MSSGGSLFLIAVISFATYCAVKIAGPGTGHLAGGVSWRISLFDSSEPSPRPPGGARGIQRNIGSQPGIGCVAGVKTAAAPIVRAHRWMFDDRRGPRLAAGLAAYR